MNEEAIAANLAKRADGVSPPPVHDSQTTEEAQGDRTPQAESGLEAKESVDPFVESQNKQEISQYLGLTPGAYNALQADTPLSNILSFIHGEVGTDKAAILNYIRGIEQAMGTTLQTPQQRLNKLNQFVVVRNQHRLLQQKQEALLG